MQAYRHTVDGIEKEIHHPVTYVSGLFRGPQINWAALVNKAYAIYMTARKLHYYISNSDTTIRSDHMLLHRFLLKNTKNATVNNWAVSIEDYQSKFEYIKGVKNTLADTMSCLVHWDSDVALPPEPDGQQFGKSLQGGEETDTDNDYLVEQVVEGPEVEPKEGPMGDITLPIKRFYPPVKGLFVGVCVRLLRRMYLSMYWEFFTHLQLMRGWNR